MTDVPPGADGTAQESVRRGRLFVLSGPSGVGKSTVLGHLRAALPELWYSVSATTRGPRPGEEHGVQYFFVDGEEFTGLVEDGRMLEWAEFAGNRYGTPRDAVEQRLAAGQDVLLEIDVQGARQVRSSALGGEAVLVFLAPPSFDELARRLIGRGTEPEPVIAARLAAARDELAAETEFDHTVVNTDIGAATDGLVGLMVGPRPGSITSTA
ncbi:guanylate kinase [Nakamurella sp. YIM 132087]|uniref:Guanylate kinase n=1 Tax=Nakamurella alba TaxID=2665158 RepID=A0A7K1FL35_9ACTN|nr:guanylate kinase [Nakamurella alba]MTD14089.1 guanylate kinase [Nakamurella alba]